MQPVLTSPRGSRIPPLLYGTAWKKENTAALVQRALSFGFSGIDTACQPKHYDEAGVGAGVAAYMGRGVQREELYMQTKFTPVDGQDPARIPYDPGGSLAQQVQQSGNVSLENLRTSYLDCLLLHSPLASFDETLQVWRAMESLVDSGVVKELGISNCYDVATLSALYGAARIKPLMVQNRFYEKTGFDRKVRAFCVQHQLFYQSFWTLTANPKLLAHPSLVALAQRYAVTAEQMLFRCLTQCGIIVLTGTTSEAHMRQDLAIFDFELKEQELKKLTQLFS